MKIVLFANSLNGEFDEYEAVSKTVVTLSFYQYVDRS